ncbi:MAG TPA: hypothetical protein VJU61_28460 [Polyangiaceae bacterium]|nr:hypothetical protein [Polyangiaceae bacterium]
MNTTPIDPVPGGVSVADVTERLMLEFGAVLPLAEVSQAVLQSFRDLGAVPAGALPELVERLARQLLQEAAVRAVRGLALVIREGRESIL